MAKKSRSLREAKAEKVKKKRRARRRKRAAVLIIEILIFIILLAIGYVMVNYDKIKSSDFDISNVWMNEGVEKEGYITFALFGGDSREGELGAGTHADTIMVASIDNQTKEIKLISVYRDTTMRQEDGEIVKANAAYFTGGPQEAISMLNRNLDLDIEDYVAVDFKVVTDVIDLLGGIEVDVTEDEATEINKYIYESATVAGKAANPVSAGVQNLDGVQALTYARIRKNVGGDYARAERQQVVVQKVFEKVKQTDLSTINEIINQVFSQVSTSFTLTEIIKLASGATKYSIGGTDGFPFERTDGSVEGLGSVVIPLGMVENVEELHVFLYPNLSYTASEMVQDIAADIEYLTGYTREDYIAVESSENTSDTEE